MNKQILKLCLSKEVSDELTDKIEIVLKQTMKLDDSVYEIYDLYEKKYEHYLALSHKIPWHRIIDIDLNSAAEYDAVVRALDGYSTEEVSYYLTVITHEYGQKQPGDEIITSYYKWSQEWNHNFMQYMDEHCEMEKAHRIYTYFYFSKVIEEKSYSSTPVNFWFKSYTKKDEGINKLYTSQGLGDMREHSSLFLDLSSRCLAFGLDRGEENI